MKKDLRRIAKALRKLGLEVEVEDLGEGKPLVALTTSNPAAWRLLRKKVQ